MNLEIQPHQENTEQFDEKYLIRNFKTIQELYLTFGAKTDRFFEEPAALNNYAQLFKKQYLREVIIVFERFPEIFFETKVFYDILNRLDNGLNFRDLEVFFLRYFEKEQDLIKILNLLSEIEINSSYLKIIEFIKCLFVNRQEDLAISFEDFTLFYDYLTVNHFFSNPNFFIDLTKHISITHHNLMELNFENLNGFKQDLIIEILDKHKSFVSLETLQKIINLDFVNLVKLKEMMYKRRFDLEYTFFNEDFDKTATIHDRIYAVMHAVFQALN